jgi:hypothetical protein
MPWTCSPKQLRDALTALREGEVLAQPRKSYSYEVGALLPSKAKIPDTATG